MITSDEDDVEELLQALEVFRKTLVRLLYAHGWNAADIDRGMELLKLAEASRVDLLEPWLS